MVFDSYPKAFQQIYKFSNFFFSENSFRVSVFLSKTPYLSASIALAGAKNDDEDVFKKGKCYLIPRHDQPAKWQHVVIEKVDFFGNQHFCFYRDRKPQKRRLKKHQMEANDVGVSAKPLQFFKEHGIVNHYANEDEWLGKHDITLSTRAEKRCKPAIYPNLVGNKSKFIEWFNKDLDLPFNEEKSLAELTGINIDDTQYSDINFLTPFKLDNQSIPTIWIDKVPSSGFKGKALIFLSPYLSNFEEKMLQIGDLFQEQKLTCATLDCLPAKLASLMLEQKAFTVSLLRKGDL